MSCHKRKHSTKRSAEIQAMSLLHCTGLFGRIYLCQKCNFYHVTTNGKYAKRNKT
jgi:heme/copper-type cytochrome/quinol oxidase subunit 3